MEDLLNSETPSFNINFQITNLPTGQLAEAQITSYDSLGRPNGNTLQKSTTTQDLTATSKLLTASAPFFESSNQTTNSVSFAHFADDSQQFNPIKVTLPSVVPSQQLISSNFPNHDLTSNFISNFKYSATNLWNILYQFCMRLRFIFPEPETRVRQGQKFGASS